MGQNGRNGDSANGGRPAAAVLIVDDDAAKRLAIRAMLANLGHQLVEADSGRAALRAILHQPFAAILMDVRMPSLDGYETARLIRERDDFALTPIIFVTAYGRDLEDSAAAYASGAVDFIFTPINGDALRAKVSLFVDLFMRSQELQRSLESLTAVHAVLNEAEGTARAVLNGASDGIVTTDQDGRIELFSASAERLFGYREAEVVGQPFQSIIAPEHHGDLRQSLMPAGPLCGGQDGSSSPTETVGARKDGSRFPIEIGVTDTVLHGRTFSVDCIRDISARKVQDELERQRGEAARRTAERDRIAFDEAPIGSVIISPLGTIERVNRAMCAMTGYTAKAMLGMPWAELTHPDDRERSTAACAGTTARTRRLERRYMHRDGSVIEAIVVVTAIPEGDRDAPHFFAQLQDVTQARQNRRELEQAQFEMLARLAAAAELHDDDTGQHTRRVGELSAVIAERLALPPAEVRMIRFASPLHDIGKLAISDTVLGKRGSLTAAQFEQVKAHSTSGAQMLSGSDFPLIKLAEQIALTHHEKWDGTGYPAGLAGEAIPIAGRIVAVADVFDALTHKRPYKQAWSVADALSEMANQSGRHFDPRVLQAFLRSAPGR
jgi:putative two-component system response regulator